MQEILQNQPDPEQRKPLPLNILLGALVVVAIALSFWFAFKSPQGSSSRAAQSNVSVPMTPAEQAYVKSIQIENIALSRAENFIHQEVTILNADAVNVGQQSVAGLTVTVEFWRVPYDIAGVQKRMREAKLPEPLVLRLQVGR